MLKLARLARGHFVTLIEISVHLIRVKPGHTSLDDFPLGAVATQKDLGVMVTNTLSWGFHISNVVAKANSKLGFFAAAPRQCVSRG